MGVDTEAFLKTNFDEFEYYLGNIILKKERMFGNKTYVWTYFFEFPSGDKYHSHVYNNKVDVKEAEYLNSLPHEEFKKVYAEIEKRDFTTMDSQNRVSEGIPNGFHGLKLDFSLFGEASEFLQMLCCLFGGYFQYSDSSGEDYIWIDKDWHKVIEWVFRGKDVFI